jgi:hypothetical protein
MLMDRVNVSDMTSLNQLRYTFQNHSQNLEDVINILKSIVAKEFFQLYEHLLIEKTMEHENIILNMWRSKPGTIEHVKIDVMSQIQGSKFEKLHIMLMEMGRPKAPKF